jgi:hypothetical protein
MRPIGEGYIFGLGARRLVAQPVERDVEDVIDLVGRAGWDLRDPAHHLDDFAEVCVAANDLSLLSALEQRSARGP